MLFVTKPGDAYRYHYQYDRKLKGAVLHGLLTTSIGGIMIKNTAVSL